MKSRLTQLPERVSQSEAVEIPAWEMLVKEGRTLPNSTTEDVSGFSLMPQYSVRQLRRINQKTKYYGISFSKTAKKEWRLTRRW